jgi:ABC-type lipoprotein release transport system permease subunit
MAGVAAVLADSVVRGLLHGLPAYDPTTLLSVAVLLVSIAVAATWPPARAALVLAPAELLREER